MCHGGRAASLKQVANLVLVVLFLLEVSSVKVKAQPTGHYDHGTLHDSRPEPADAWNWTSSPVHCVGTSGHWCQDFAAQAPISKARHRPRKLDDSCLGKCSGNGVCSRDLGLCDCEAGWTGAGCHLPQFRHCANKHRSSGFKPQGTPLSLSEPGFLAGRCGGICDEALGACFCNGTYGRIPAPPGALPGTPPIQMGRPMVLNDCNPSKDDRGEPTGWGNVEPDLLYGQEQGWCEAANPAHRCNSSTPAAGQPDMTEARPWSAPHAHVPALAAADLRVRPLVYVYDLPSIYNTRLLQYRVVKGSCFWRTFHDSNVSKPNDWAYSLESLLHEHLLQSPHRTLDPEEADFFYVPVYTSCFIHPIYGWADMPWWHGPAGPRVMHTARMLLEAKQWLQTHLPYWNRRGGKDHVWLVTHDEGSCWVPSEVRPSIILSHWGRKDLEHQSNTAFSADNYTEEYVHPEWSPDGWLHLIKGHPCYDPGKDLIVPSHKHPGLIGESPLLGYPERRRTVLASFQGDLGTHRKPHYSRGIRQRLRAVSKEHRWRERHGIVIGGRAAEDYGALLSASTFCLVIPGDGFSTRAEDCILHGSIPVLIMDDVDPPFATILDWAAFSVRIPEAFVEQLPHILGTVPRKQRQLMLQRWLYHRINATR
ncbi:hypothetical protein WJX73_005210 [Symbiochloris irregularis]|uniref:EGF-like domain-containing protein n=1 Tax=Symbiochloris irregularis TaxID=706552 RepID=A0AAW1P5R7_9CHLO